MSPSSSGTEMPPVRARTTRLPAFARFSFGLNAALRSSIVPARRIRRLSRFFSTTSRPCACAKASTLATSAGSAPSWSANSSRDSALGGAADAAEHALEPRPGSSSPQDDRDLDPLLGSTSPTIFARGSFCFWLPGTMTRFLPGMSELLRGYGSTLRSWQWVLGIGDSNAYAFSCLTSSSSAPRSARYGFSSTAARSNS